MRKTVRVLDLIRLVNKRNRVSICKPEVRQGWNSLLEAVLMETRTYAGYLYLRQEDVPEGHLPGIEWPKADSPVFPDDTRRYYLVHRKIQNTKV